MLKARKILAGMAPGEHLEVITTDPMSVVDMPVFCAQAGHRIVSERKRESDYRFLIRRGTGGDPAESPSTARKT